MGSKRKVQERAREASRRTLRRRLREVSRSLRAVERGGSRDAETVHALRVSTRRAAAATRAAEAWAPRGQTRRVRRRLGAIRDRAAPLRDDDVLLDRLTGLAPSLDPVARRAADALARALREDRADASKRLRRSAKALRRALKKARGALLSASAGAPEQTAWAPVVRAAIGGVRNAAAEDLADPPHLHRLRIAIKRLRYAVDSAPRPRPAVRRRFATLQDTLGEANDARTLLDRALAWAKSASADGLSCAEVAELLASLREDRALAERAAIDLVRDGLLEQTLRDVEAWLVERAG